MTSYTKKLQVLDCTELLSLRWATYSDVPRFKEAAAGLELSRLRESFVFPPNLYGYIFQGIEHVSGGRTGLVRRTVEWNGTQHPYYQDEARRRLFVPAGLFQDRAKSGTPQGAGDDRAGDVARRIAGADSGVDQLPGGARDRRRSAGVSAPAVAGARTEGGSEATLEPLPASTIKFKLGLPRVGSTAVSFTEQRNALVAMSSLRHSVDLAMEAFQSLFDAIFSTSSLIFQGQLEVSIGERDAIPPIPFQGRMNDLAGDPLEGVARRQDGRLVATLRNAIESPVRILQMNVMLQTADRSIAAQVEGLPLPASLGAGREVSFTLLPATALEAGERVEARFDLRQVEIQPDREAVWNAVLDTAVQPEYVRKVGVRTVAELFRGPDPKVSLIRVNLQRGGGPVVAVDLTEQRLAEEAALHSPLRDYVLGRVDAGEFQYQVLAVRGGMRTPTSSWKTASTNLIVTSEDLT